jgi:hypothetical protein
MDHAFGRGPVRALLGISCTCMAFFGISLIRDERGDLHWLGCGILHNRIRASGAVHASFWR